MAIVKKGNRELTIAEHKVSDFIAEGYDLIDEKGDTLQKGNPISLTDYKEQYVKAEKELEKANETIKSLESKAEELEKANETIAILEEKLKELDKAKSKK